MQWCSVHILEIGELELLYRCGGAILLTALSSYGQKGHVFRMKHPSIFFRMATTGDLKYEHSGLCYV